MENNRLRRIEWIDLRFPTVGESLRFVGWAVGRAGFSIWLFGLNTVRATCKITINVVDQTEKASRHLLDVYSQMPHMGIMGSEYMDTTATVIGDIQPISDLIAAIEGKQLMIIGEMGTGKSTIAQYLAYTIGGKVKVYECEGTPEDWQGLEVVGKGEDWQAIEAGMRLDLDDLSNQMKLRTELGDAVLTGTQKVIICEEYPELVSKVEISSEWLERHARRGRKARRFTILLSQYDRVAAWGLEGKASLADAFCKLRLGKKAVAHAKSLKREDLIDWLDQDRSHCLFDDEACKLPPYREMKAVTQRLSIPASSPPVVTAEPTVGQGFQPIEPPSEPSSSAVKKAVKACLEAGFSESDVIKNVLGFKGEKYKEGKQVLEQIKGEN